MDDQIRATAGVVYIFQLCIQSFDSISQVPCHDRESLHLIVRLYIEKCRLYVWGESGGLTQVTVGAQEIALEKCKFLHTIEKTLSLLLDLLNSSEQTRQKYGCESVRKFEQILPMNEQNSSIADIDTALAGFPIAASKVKPAMKLLKKTCWFICDTNKFKQLITRAKELIDGIQEIAKDVIDAGYLDRIVAYRLQHIRSISTVEMVAGVCKEDYPVIFNAVSYRTELLTLPVHTRQAISDWTRSIEPADKDGALDLSTAAMANMTISGFQQSLTSLLHHRRRPALQSTTASTSSTGAMVLYKPLHQETERSSRTSSSMPDVQSALSTETLVRKELEANPKSLHDLQAVVDVDHHHQPFDASLLRRRKLPRREMDKLLTMKALRVYPPAFYDDKIRFWEPELKGIVKAELNENIASENDAMSEWFQILNDDEKNAIMFTLSKYLSSSQTLFFSDVFNRKADGVVNGFYGRQERSRISPADEL